MPEPPVLNLGDPRLTGNPSGTPRMQLGGLALNIGILMRSRTGYAIARRNPCGIEVRCVPFSSLVATGPLARTPIVRGVLSFWEMAAVALAADNGTIARSLGGEWSHRQERTRLLQWGGLLLGMGVLVPGLMSMVWLNVTGGSAFTNECDHPSMFAIGAAGLRYGFLIAGGIVLSMRESRAQLLRHHGAEHRSVAVFEAGREVTVARAQRASILHRRCGTMLYVYAIAVLALLEGGLVHLYRTQWGGFPSWPMAGRALMIGATSLMLAPAAVGIAVEVLRAASILRMSPAVKPWEWPGILYQRLTVKSPTNEEVEVAIVALEAALSISPEETDVRTHLIPGLVDDESAPGFRRPQLARPAPIASGTTGDA